MYKSQYDDSVLVWSPDGRIHQVEYAMETVNIGSANVAAKTKTYAVVCSFQRAASTLASHQQKIFEIDSNCGVAISGLTADARVLIKWMRAEVINHRYLYESPPLTEALLTRLLNRSQINTQRYGWRPYGVGLLFAVFDQTGPHIYETCPSGSLYDWRAHGIGYRCQSARTYMEQHIDQIEASGRDELIMHCIRALNETLAFDKADQAGLTPKNCSVGVVGEREAFHLLTPDEAAPFLSALPRRPTATEAPPAAETPAA